MRKTLIHFLVIISLFAAGKLFAIENNVLNTSDEKVNLQQGFKTPPLYARPRVFWWWLNSMATKESITHDLEELKDKGFGGVMLFDATSSAYYIAAQTPPGPEFASKEWKVLFVHALKEADRLELEVSLNIQSGWNPGGPSVMPQDGMKKIVRTEVIAKGTASYKKVLSMAKGYFYQDIAVQAYRTDEAKKAPPIKNWVYKSLNRKLPGGGAYPLYMLREQFPAEESESDVSSHSIIDLSANMDQYGLLKWQIPPGTWRIIRYGSVLTGAQVSTSSHGWQGLSFNHLSTTALNNYLSKVVDPILQSAGDLVGKSFKYLHTDSWEMGSVNWSNNFPAEFKRLRGYDMTPYFPVLADKIVDSREVSNRFLYDFRKTVGDLIADRMYAKFAEYAHKHGLLVHPESGGPHSAPIDALKCLGRSDVPMGEFWARVNTHRVSDDERLFIKQSSSAAHIYGKRFIAGEGPTSIGPHWERAPKDLKSVFDRNFCEGINRFFWHCFTSSPKQFGMPGNEYFAGTHLNPNTTWWEKSYAWTRYLSRCSFMLSQGLFQADVCIYYGDDVPNFVLRKRTLQGLGPGYDYDECNAEVILTRMSVKHGRIVLPDGMTYRILQLPDRDAITLEVLQKIEQLVKDGATIVGSKPVKSTGLTGYPQSDQLVKEIADRLWKNCDGKMVTENHYGKGRVFWGKSMREILLADGIQPDFDFKSSLNKTQLDFTHRKTENINIYFVANRLARHGIYDTKYRYLPTVPDRYEAVECYFRVSGKQPEIWDPMTGIIIKQPVYREENGQTIVLLRLNPEGSVFIVFREKHAKNPIVAVSKESSSLFPIAPQCVGDLPTAKFLCEGKNMYIEVYQKGVYKLENSNGRSVSIKIDEIPPIQKIEGPWELNFPVGWGAPEQIIFDKLLSWTESENNSIKYFSGTATYRKQFDLADEAIEGMRLYLDLGNVQELAEVKLNGESSGIIWIAPFRIDITELVKVGTNKLELEVVNLWPNRLIGDQFLPEEKRYTRTNIRKFLRNSPLRISGLLGPVRIIFSKRVRVLF
ncbi:hypothetical protein ES705_05858 [subsurface metagenome]